MICPKCEHELEENDLFCRYCGASAKPNNNITYIKIKNNKKINIFLPLFTVLGVISPFIAILISIALYLFKEDFRENSIAAIYGSLGGFVIRIIICIVSATSLLGSVFTILGSAINLLQ